MADNFKYIPLNEGVDYSRSTERSIKKNNEQYEDEVQGYLDTFSKHKYNGDGPTDNDTDEAGTWKHSYIDSNGVRQQANTKKGAARKSAKAQSAGSNTTDHTADGVRPSYSRREERQARRDERDKYRDTGKKLEESNIALEQQLVQQARGQQAAPNEYSDRYNYETYKYDYYSGSQAKVFIGDIWVDDVVTIQYNVRQTKEPIYGYASQNYDAVAMGTVLGEGTMVVAFKEVGYLNVIRSYLQEQEKGVGQAQRNIQERAGNSASASTSDYSARVGKTNPGLIRKSETIENVLDQLNDANVRVERDAADRSTINNNVHFDTGMDGRRNKDFEDAAEVLEDVIWGDTNGKPLTTVGQGTDGLLRADEFDYISNNKGANQGIKSARGNNYEDVTNILITFGDMTDKRAEHTLYALNDIHFTGQSVMISPTGEPIAEVYNFFFRDINKSINTRNFKVNPVKFKIGTDQEFYLATLEDVRDAMNTTEAVLTVYIKSAKLDGKWEAYGPAKVGNFTIMNSTVAKVNTMLETEIREYLLENSDVYDDIAGATELAVTVTGLSRDGNLLPEIKSSNPDQTTEGLNYILERQTEFGANFKVTSPTTSPYKIVDLVRREDFFKGKPTDPKGAKNPNDESIPTFPEVATKVDTSNPVTADIETAAVEASTKERAQSEVVEDADRIARLKAGYEDSEGATKEFYARELKALNELSSDVIAPEITLIEKEQAIITQQYTAPVKVELNDVSQYVELSYIELSKLEEFRGISKDALYTVGISAGNLDSKADALLELHKQSVLIQKYDIDARALTTNDADRVIPNQRDIDVTKFVDFTAPKENVAQEFYIPYDDEGAPAIGYGNRIDSLTDESLVVAGIATTTEEAQGILEGWKSYDATIRITNEQAKSLSASHIEDIAVPEVVRVFESKGVVLTDLPLSVQQAAIDVAYQTGNLSQFEGFINSTSEGDFTTAAFELAYQDVNNPSAGATSNYTQTPNRVYSRLEQILSDEEVDINREQAAQLLSQLDNSQLNSTNQIRYGNLLRSLQ